MAIDTQRMFAFLVDLRENNDRAWFDANRRRYDDHLVAPALALVDALADPLADVSPHFRAIAKKQGGSLFRIFRDTRFSRDKTPYKTHVGLHLRHEVTSKEVHAPGFYVHLEPGACGVGVGMWQPPPDALGAVRQAIAADVEGWRETRRRLDGAGLSLGGEALKKPPKGFDADHEHVEDLKRKDFTVWKALTDEQVHGRDLPARLGAIFSDAAPLAGFLCGAIGLPF
jgi:uncharacterized protein (TIGR02453 family)